MRTMQDHTKGFNKNRNNTRDMNPLTNASTHTMSMTSQRESYAPSGVKLPPPHDIATQTPLLHVGVAESVQSADAEHVVTTAAVVTMVLSR